MSDRVNSSVILGIAVSLILALRVTLHQMQVEWYWLVLSVLFEAVLGIVLGRRYARRAWSYRYGR